MIDVVFMEKSRGPRTEPCGTPVTGLCDVDTSPPQATSKKLSVMKEIRFKEPGSENEIRWFGLALFFNMSPDCRLVLYLIRNLWDFQVEHKRMKEWL